MTKIGKNFHKSQQNETKGEEIELGNLKEILSRVDLLPCFSFVLTQKSISN